MGTLRCGRDIHILPAVIEKIELLPWRWRVKGGGNAKASRSRPSHLVNLSLFLILIISLHYCRMLKSINHCSWKGDILSQWYLYLTGGYHNGLNSGADPGFGQGGAPASEAESCRHSEAESRERSEHSAAGVQGPLKGPGSFWVFDAQICILTHSRDSFSLIFDIYFDTKSW